MCALSPQRRSCVFRVLHLLTWHYTLRAQGLAFGAAGFCTLQSCNELLSRAYLYLVCWSNDSTLTAVHRSISGDCQMEDGLPLWPLKLPRRSRRMCRTSTRNNLKPPFRFQRTFHRHGRWNHSHLRGQGGLDLLHLREALKGRPKPDSPTPCTRSPFSQDQDSSQDEDGTAKAPLMQQASFRNACYSAPKVQF